MLPKTIQLECSQFLAESAGLPLIKSLPSVGEGFRKVKVRRRNSYSHEYERYFDASMSGIYKDIRLRSIMIDRSTSIIEDDSLEPFYIFPIDGYKILYNKHVTNSTQYMQEIDKIVKDSVDAENLLKHLFEFTYGNIDLKTALQEDAEIIIYSIPYYYAIRKTLIENYANFIGTYDD